MEKGSLGRLILGSYAIKSIALLLALLFVLIAPNLMGTAYTEYIFYTRAVAFLALILTLGSAGTISRFVPELDHTGIGALIGRAYRTKYLVAILLFAPVLIYSAIVDNYVFLLLLLLALVKALFEALLILAYALEHYREKLYFQSLHALGRLLLLPFFLLSQTGYIAATELLGYIPALRACYKRFGRKRISSMFWAKSRQPPSQVDASLLARVESHTYVSNLLYYLLPILPVLIFNHQASHSLRELTISYVLAVNVVYTLASAINDIVLPRLVRHRRDRQRLALFLLLCIVLAAASGAVVVPVFGLVESRLAHFYGLEALTSFYPFLLFGLTLIVLNGVRQIMFVRDHSALFSLILVLGYIYLIYQLASGEPLVEIITPMSLGLLGLSILLTLLTLKAARNA